MRLSGYEITREIGSGGMGTVYHAIQTSLDRPVAIKAVHRHLAKDPSIRTRFFNEAKLTAALSHPHIVQVFDFLESNEELLIVMEYIEGRCLDRMIGQEVGPIPWEKALPLFGQVLSGVGYAHARGVVHRDIKPANILVSTTGEVKITDFGIAKIAGQKGMTRTGAQMGTLYYEAPEQIKGARDVDHRADIYALGMTLYEMLAGRLPFDEAGDTSEFQVMNTIVNRQAHLDPREYYPHIPEWLVGVVQKATELESEARYQSCEEFLKALEHEGKVGTGEHGYWSGRVASAPISKPISKEFPQSVPSPLNPENSCPKCGASLKDEMEFCGKCGADLQQECPGCKKRIRWHHEYCPKCGVNIELKKIENEEEAKRRKVEEARLREEARIAEEKRKAEEARVAREWEEYNQKKAEEKQRKEDEKRQKAEDRKQKIEEVRQRFVAFNERWKQWWKRNGWKVATVLVLVGLGRGYLSYRNSELYDYHQAERLYKVGDLSGAASAFSELGDYRDSWDRANAVRYELAEGLYESGDLSGAASAFSALGDYWDSRERSNAVCYEIAEGLYESGDLSGAASAFEGIAGYRDSHERSNALWYETAEGLYESGDLSAAASAFEGIAGYRDSRERLTTIRYEIAEGLYESGDLSAAASAFSVLGDYRDSRDWVRVIGWHLLGFTKEGEVITDNNTNLQWRVGPDRNISWNAANTWVNGLGGGWRMPTRAELRGLWDTGISRNNWGPFENSGYLVWSGEVRDSSSAWGFNFLYGFEYWRARGTSSNLRAFAVRPRG